MIKTILNFRICKKDFSCYIEDIVNITPLNSQGKMKMPDSDYAVLREFLALPHKAELVLEKFAALPGAIRKKGGDNPIFIIMLPIFIH